MVVRSLVVRCPDWPVVASGRPPSEPTAVVRANRVVACSTAARADGVGVGMRLRQAQGRCPSLHVLERDLSAEARAFEPVLSALEQVTSRTAELPSSRACRRRSQSSEPTRARGIPPSRPKTRSTTPPSALRTRQISTGRTGQPGSRSLSPTPVKS